MGSAELVDWLTAKPPSLRLRVPGRVSKSGPDWSEPEPGRHPLTRSQLGAPLPGPWSGDSDTESGS